MTHFTLVGAQASVSATVLTEHRGVSKALAALPTGIWLLTCVGALVNLQLG